MQDHIVIERIWQDNDFFEIKTTCESEFITATSNVYTTDQCVDDLYKKIQRLIDNDAEECFWETGEKGDSTTPCISMKISHNDKLGHLQIEVYLELDDGGRLSNHNCCFYVNTELGALIEFQKNLYKIKEPQLGGKVVLN